MFGTNREIGLYSFFFLFPQQLVVTRKMVQMKGSNVEKCLSGSAPDVVLHLTQHFPAVCNNCQMIVLYNTHFSLTPFHSSSVKGLY